MELQISDWSRLKVFRSVAETGSISAAASQLAVSPAKISRDLEELERRFGQELFLRSPRGMELTGIGALVLRSVRSMEDSAQAISSHVSEVAIETRTKVVIAAHDAIATYWLARRLPAFHQLNPNIEITLKVVQDTPNVANGDADIAIQYEAPTTPNVISRTLGWVHYILFASPAYLSIHGVPADMFDLGRHRIVLHSGYNKQVEMWEAKSAAWAEVMPRTLQSNSSTVILENCACDGGVALMPSYVAEIEPRVDALSHIRPLASIRFWLAYSERVRGRAFTPVLEWLRECFDPEHHPWFRETYSPPRGAVQ